MKGAEQYEEWVRLREGSGLETDSPGEAWPVSGGSAGSQAPGWRGDREQV